MNDIKKSDPKVVFFGICIIFGIIGIILAISSIIKRNEDLLFFVSLMIIGGEIQNTLISAIIFDGIRPNFPIFVLGIIMAVIGFVGTFSIAIYKFPDFRAYLDDQKKKRLLIFVFFICISLFIIGIILIINLQINRDSSVTLLLAANISKVEALVQIILLSFMFRPNLPIFQSGVLLIVIGSVGTILSIIIYKNPDFLSELKSYDDILPEKRRSALIHKINTEKIITISKCPACNAPLKKSPPCECDYCGNVLK
ncbi:MAG: hypothetical protein ACFFCM_08685 [Promethearchaeota archaeon]